MRSAEPDDNAFTGLEAAIIFIAFIVVAAVFSSVVLGVGMFTTQKSQEVVNTGLEQAGGALRLGSTVIAQEYQGTGTLRFLEFDLETATDLSAIDMDCMTISIATPDTLVTLPPGDSRVTMTWRHREDNDSLLETGDLATIRLDVRAIGIRAGDTFTVEINAAEGATASITRTVPTSIERDAFVELF